MTGLVAIVDRLRNDLRLELDGRICLSLWGVDGLEAQKGGYFLIKRKNRSIGTLFEIEEIKEIW